MFFIRDEMSASLASSMLKGGGADGSSGIGAMLVLFGEVGGDSEPRREPMEDDRECLLFPDEDEDFVEKENSGEGAVKEEEGDVFAEDEVLEPGLLDELETFESTDSRRRTLVCCECRIMYAWMSWDLELSVKIPFRQVANHNTPFLGLLKPFWLD